jgi:hypothetical protein
VAASTACSGMSANPSSESLERTCEICQFWQKRQCMLQPAVAIENERVPGRKW